MTAWNLAPGEERPVSPAVRRSGATLTVDQIVRRCEELGARVTLSGNTWTVLAPDRAAGPVFLPVRLGNGRERQNLLAALRRAGLDVLADPQPEEPATVAAPTPVDVATKRSAPANVATKRSAPANAIHELHQQMQTMLEMLAEAEARDAKLSARIEDVETRLNRTPGAPPAIDPHADLDDLIVAFLNATPIRLPAAVIAANLNDAEATESPVDAALVALRLDKLAADGKGVVIYPADSPEARMYRARP